MKSRHWKVVAVVILVGVMLCVAASEQKGKKRPEQPSSPEAVEVGEVERKVTEAEVPAAALAAIKKLAAGAEITESAEEIEHGHIAVMVGKTAQGEAHVVVIDDGPSIAAEYHERVFDRFYRVDKDRSRTQGGTGLGLAIAKHAVELNGGRIERESEQGKGSTQLAPISVEGSMATPDGDIRRLSLSRQHLLSHSSPLTRRPASTIAGSP